MRQTTQLNKCMAKHHEHYLESCATLHKSKHEGPTQEPAEPGPHHQTAPSCPTHTGEQQRKRGQVASTSRRTPNANSRRTAAHRARQRSTQAGHRQLCKLGPARLRPTESKPRWEDCCQAQAHTSTSREQSPNSFTWQVQKCTEAVLDAAIRWLSSLHTTVADVTVRCPHASRCRGDVTASPTEAAEDEKHKRHGPRVTPIAFSTFGRLGREGRNALEALAAKARWNSHDQSTQRNQVARWRKTLEQDLLHAQADVLLLSLGAQGCAGWQRHAGTPFGRQRTAAKHTYKLTDEQVTTIRSNRVIAVARRQVLRAKNYQSEQSKQQGAEATSETELEEQHEICDNDASRGRS